MKETITSGDDLSSHASSCKRPPPTPIKMVARTKSASVRAKQLFEQAQALKRQQEQEAINNTDNSDSDDNSSNSSNSSSKISTNSTAYSISSEEILEEVCARSLMVLNKQDNLPIIITDDENSPKLIPDNEDERGLSAAVMIGEDEDVLKTLVALKDNHSNQEAIINQQQCTTMDHVASPEDYSSSVITNTPIAPVIPEEKIIQHAQIEQKHYTIEEHPNMRNTEIGNTQHLTLPYNPNHAEQRSTTDLSDNTQQYSAASVDGQSMQATTAIPSSTNVVTPSLKNNSILESSPTLPSLSQIYRHTEDGQQHATVATPPQSSLPTYPHQQQYTVNSSPAQTYPESHYLNSYGSSIGSTRNSPPQSPNIISSSTPPTVPVLPPHGNTYQTFSSPPRYHQDTIASAPVSSSSPHDIYTQHYHQPPFGCTKSLLDLTNSRAVSKDHSFFFIR